MKIDYDVPVASKDLDLVTDYQNTNLNATIPPAMSPATNTSVPTPNNLQKVGTGGEKLAQAEY